MADREVFSFKINNNYFGVDTTIVDSISDEFKRTDVPCSSNLVKEMISYREQVIPVVNLGEYLFGHSTYTDETEPMLMICNVGEQKVAFEIDEPSSIIKLEDTARHEVGSIISNMAYMLDSYVVTKDKRILGVINLDKLYADLAK